MTADGADGIAKVERIVARLDEIIDEAITERSRIGYFAAMYRKVTVAVRDGIAAGQFEDGPRMAELDRVFAERFIDAYDTWRSANVPTRAWQIVFVNVAKRRLLIVQHLLIAMNAHINLDLGIAAATVAPGAEIESLKGDFDQINVVLGDLQDGFLNDVEALSPWIKWLGRIGGHAEDHIIKFSITKARDEAWRFAKELAELAPGDQEASIASHDEGAELLGRVIARPGIFLPLGLAAIRLRESNDIVKVINHLRA